MNKHPKNTIEVIENALNHAYNVVNENIKSIDVNGNTLSFWPLFLVKEHLKYSPYEVYTGATSIGAMCLFELVKKTMSVENKKDLQNACETLLWMRNSDGSWPSIILLSTREAPKMEGVLHDTIYALDTLIKIGFLSHTPIIEINKEPKTGKDLSNLSERAKLILNSVKWLLNNQVKDGWDYTGIEFLHDKDKEEVNSGLLPTANAVLISYSIINELTKAQLLDTREDDIGIIAAYNNGIKWIRSIQDDAGGFGKKRGEKPTIAHTAIAIKVLLTDEGEESKKAILKGIRWILKNKQSYSMDKIEPQDIFDEYRQIIIKNDGTIMWRVIHHENFIEGILLDVLIEAETKGHIDRLNLLDKYRFRGIVEATVKSLLDRQEKSGRLKGAFKSRRGAPAEEFPIYAIYFGVLGLKKVKDNYQHILNKPSLRTLILWSSGIIFIILLIPIIFAWAFNLSFIKAIGIFVAELIIGGLSTFIAKILRGKT